VIGNYQSERILQRRIIQQLQRLGGTAGEGDGPARSKENTPPGRGLNGIVVNKEDIGSHSRVKGQSFYFFISVMQGLRKSLP
jgi:hypothetical protein